MVGSPASRKYEIQPGGEDGDHPDGGSVGIRREANMRRITGQFITINSSNHFLENIQFCPFDFDDIRALVTLINGV
jgi:hypothetical protein